MCDVMWHVYPNMWWHVWLPVMPFVMCECDDMCDIICVHLMTLECDVCVWWYYDMCIMCAWVFILWDILINFFTIPFQVILPQQLLPWRVWSSICTRLYQMWEEQGIIQHWSSCITQQMYCIHTYAYIRTYINASATWLRCHCLSSLCCTVLCISDTAMWKSLESILDITSMVLEIIYYSTIY